MKLIIIIITAGFLQVSAATFGQNVTLSEKNASLELVLEKIKSQTGRGFYYVNDVFSNAKKVNIKVNNAPLDKVLNDLFEGQPLTYKIEEGVIIVKEKGLLDKIKDYFAEITVTGKVVDESGRPLSGASVTLKSNGKGVSTDIDGSFSMSGIQEGEFLIAKFIGYSPKEFKAAKTVGVIQLALTDNKLDEIQVQAYGITSKRKSIANISTVKKEELERTPVINPIVALQGRVAGLEVTQANGTPGGGVTIRVQGRNNITSGNDPLIVVDGVPYPSQLLSTGLNLSFLGNSGGSSLSPAAAGSSLNFLNMSNIESIDILKDADATAIYGTRAANGAIVITTKKGKPGKLKFDLSLSSGFSQITNKLDVMSSTEYVNMRNEAFRNDNIVQTDANAYDIRNVYGFDNNRTINWQEELLGKNSNWNDSQLSLSGGNTNTQYLVNINYNHQGTITKGDFGQNRIGAKFGINTTSNDQKFKLNLNTSYINDKNIGNTFAVFQAFSVATNLAPTSPNLYNADGSLNWAPDVNGNTTWLFSNGNPLANLLLRYQNQTTNLMSSANISYQILKKLIFSANLGYTNISSKENTQVPLSSYEPAVRAARTRSASFANNYLTTVHLEPQLTYSYTSSFGTFNFLAGGTLTRQINDGQVISGSGFSSDNLLDNISASTTISKGSTVALTYKYTGLFGRINYDYRGRYLVSFNLRRDGTSRFSPENQFNNFYSYGAGWVFSEEDFIKDRFDFLSFGKLNGTYGITGSDQIPDYQFLNTYTPINYANPYQGVGGYTLDKIYNPGLVWGETRKLNLGLSLGFLKDRIIASFNYANNKTSNQHLSYNLPSYASGLGFVLLNFPATVQNKSYEFVLNTTNLSSKDWTWKTDFNLTIPKNKLLEWQGIEKTSYANSYKVGESLNSIQLYHFLGVDPATGFYRVADKNGNPTFNPNSSTDRFWFNTDSRYYGGISNSVRYKGIQLDIMLEFKNRFMANSYFGRNGTPAGFLSLNAPVYLNDRWQNPGDIALHQKYTTTIGPLGLDQTFNSDAAYQRLSVVRLKNVAISWELPQTIIKKMHLNSLRIFANGQNVGYLSNYFGLDPDSPGTGGALTTPPLKTFAFGLSASF